MTTVLLAVDESPESEHAARTAAALFGTSATYLAVNVADADVAWFPAPTVWGGVYPYLPAYPLGSDEMAALEREDVREAEHVAATAAANAEVAADVVGATGDPVTAILEAAEDNDVDVIVVGAREKSWWQRLLEGSVSSDVAQRAHRPVLLVRAD